MKRKKYADGGKAKEKKGVKLVGSEAAEKAAQRAKKVRSKPKVDYKPKRYADGGKVVKEW